MAKLHIDPLDDASKAALIKAVADRGYANGLKAAAMLLDEMAKHHMRVVGINVVRDLAEAMRGKSAELHREASDKIAALDAASRT